MHKVWTKLVANLMIFSSILNGQSLDYELISESIIVGDIPNIVYSCEGFLHNYSEDTLEVKFTRIKLDVSSNLIKSSICTDSVCYATAIDTVIELIPPELEYKVDIQWVVFDFEEELEEETGCTLWQIEIIDENLITDTIESSFVYNALTTSIKRPDFDINYYPNPVQDRLYFSSINYDALISLYTINGAKVGEKKINSGYLDLSNLSNGTYLGVLEHNGKMYNIRFIKE